MPILSYPPFMVTVSCRRSLTTGSVVALSCAFESDVLKDQLKKHCEERTVQLSTGSDELKWLWVYACRQWRVHAISIGLTIIAGVLIGLEPILLKRVVDAAVQRESRGIVLLFAAALLALNVLQVTCYGFGQLFRSAAAERTGFDMRVSLLNKLSSPPVGGRTFEPAGDVLYRIEQDVDRTKDAAGGLLAQAVLLLSVSGSSVVVMWSMSKELTGISLIVIPGVLFIKGRFRPILERAANHVQSCHAARTAFLYEHLTGITEVQLLSRTLAQCLRFVRIAATAVRSELTRRRTEIELKVWTAMPTAIATALIIAYGGNLVHTGVLTIGTLIAFYAYLGRLLSPVEALVETYSQLHRAAASVRRLREIAHSRQHQRPFPLPVPFKREATITLTDVVVIRDGRCVLEGVSLSLPPGQSVALTGASGSGKTTLSHVVVGLCEPDRGDVMIDRLSTRGFAKESLWATTISLVPQHPVLFDMTVRENVLYGNRHASAAQLEQAAWQSDLTSVLERLANGWEERVGQLGDRLSEGERKRVALARALLQNTQFLILDEITAGLDGAAEERILDRLRFADAGRTIIMIGHSRRILRWAERVVVLERGRLVADGAHLELYGTNRAYRTLYDRKTDPPWTGGCKPLVVPGADKRQEAQVFRSGAG